MEAYALAYQYKDFWNGTGDRVKVKIFADRKDAVKEANRIHDLCIGHYIINDDGEEGEETETCSIPDDPNRWENCKLTHDFFSIQPIKLDIESSLISEFRL